MNIMGTGTMYCARNAGVNPNEPHIATKWMTLCYLRLWPLGIFRLQRTGFSGAGFPGIGLLTSQYAVLETLPWTSNKGHIFRSLIVGWGIIGSMVWSLLYG